MKKQMISQIQFDVIMMSLPIVVLLYIESSPTAKEHHFTTNIQNFENIPRQIKELYQFQERFTFF